MIGDPCGFQRLSHTQDRGMARGGGAERMVSGRESLKRMEDELPEQAMADGTSKAKSMGWRLKRVQTTLCKHIATRSDGIDGG